MYFNEGLTSFYKGFVPSIFLSIYGVIQMFCYENINFLLGFNPKDKNANMLLPFVTGGISKCVASGLFLPVNVIRMRL